jgi:phosphopantothenoylcysteine decarboxylase/phosphopantothenate--cysteine ligase
VGFAAETQNVLAYAKDKLLRKNLDMIIANDVSDSRIGFNSEDNEVTVLWQNKKSGADEKNVFALQSKAELACNIIELIATELASSS